MGKEQLAMGCIVAILSLRLAPCEAVLLLGLVRNPSEERFSPQASRRGDPTSGNDVANGLLVIFRGCWDKGWLKRTYIRRFYESAFYEKDAFMSKSCKIQKPDIFILPETGHFYFALTYP